MNNINFRNKKGHPGRVDMTISTEMLESFKDLFDMEIELLQGANDILEDGSHHCIVDLDGYKLKMFEDFMRLLASHPAMEVTIIGVKVNKN